MKTWSTPVREEKSTLIPCSCCGSLVFEPALECEGFGFIRCKVCSLVQMNPQPIRNEIIARYSSTFGKDYLLYELENEAVFLRLQQCALKDVHFFKLEKTFMLRTEDVSHGGESYNDAPLYGEPSVLDVGCATGALLAFLRERGWRVTGVEISPCAEHACNVRKLDVRNIPLEENKFSQGSFDVVLASHLIEHLNDPCSFLTEVNRILKNDGYIFITTPNVSGFQARFYGGRWRSAIFDHLYLFSASTLKKMLIKTGFKIEEIHTWGGIAAGLAPSWLKKSVDFFAKLFNIGDVMIVRAKKA